MSSPSQRSNLRTIVESTLAALLVSGVLSGIFASISGSGRVVVRFGLLVPVLGAVGLLLGMVLGMLVLTTKDLNWTSALRRRAQELLLAGPIVLLVWWALGVGALRVLALGEEHAPRGGVILGAGAIVLVTWGSWFIEQTATWMRSKPVAPRAALLVLISTLAGGVALSVGVGSTSGTGPPWALFGVFKRPELDLSGVALLATCAVACLVGGFCLQARSLGAVNVAGVLTVLLMVAGVLRAAQVEFKSAVAIQREAGLAATSLRVLQRLTDRDGDGSAAYFGGGDCDDSDSAVHPAATENYDNTQDDNCDGITTRPASNAPASQPGVTQVAAPEAAGLAELPSDLNVLLLTVDTLRAELGYSGLAGTRPGISPHLDRLAARSTVFERAYSLASYTSKSLGPLLIGRYPSETPRSFEHFDRFPVEARFIQERILEAGIQTLSIQGYWYFYLKGYGFERGWDTLEHGAAPRVIAIEGDRTKNGDKVADDTIMYLKQLTDRPSRFFMWTHWVDPHAEYVPHPAHDYGKGERERYDGEVSFVDAQIGRVLAALEETKLAAKTAIIVTSDHGEAFGEHGLIRHGFEVWEELVHVPLLLHVPGWAAKRVAARRSLIDVAPTILSLLQLPVDSAAFAGKSLLTDVQLPAGALPEQRPVLVDMPEGPHNKERRAYFTGDHKLIVSAGRVLGLYDLQADPGEKHDLSEDLTLTARVRAEYDDFVAGLKPIPAKK